MTAGTGILHGSAKRENNKRGSRVSHPAVFLDNEKQIIVISDAAEEDCY